MGFHSLFFFKKKPKRVNQKFSQNLVCEIVEKVKYNIPTPNLKLFEKDFFGVRHPVFVEHSKNITVPYAKSLFLAGLIASFELVVFYENKEDVLPLKRILKNARFLNKNILSKNIKAKIYSLNINFKHQNFVYENSSKMLINNQEIFAKKLDGYNAFENDAVALTETYFLGCYIFVKNKNGAKNNYLIKKIIKNNYFILKKDKFSYFFNLSTKEKFFVKCTQKTKVDIKKHKSGRFLVAEFYVSSDKDFCFYVGKENINIFDKNLKSKILFLKEKSFQNKIFAKNKILEKFFNCTLPKKIQEKKLSGFLDYDLKEEKLYFKVKNKIIRFEKNTVFFQNCKGVQSYQTTFCGKKKIINFFYGKPKVVVGGQSFFGVKSVSLKIFEMFDKFDVYG